MGWAGMVRIDNITHQWHGQWISEAINVTDRQITPTRTILILNLGPAQLTVTFLSPIEVSPSLSSLNCLYSRELRAQSSDLVRQSISFTYIAIDINFTDNTNHEVVLWMDMTGGALGQIMSAS